MKKGRLIVMSAPSGAGKGTLCKELFKKRDDIVFSISATTREPRKGEQNGVNYHFVTTSEFEKMIENSELLEYARVFNNYYGTPKKEVFNLLQKGIDVLLEIDVQGAMQIKKIYDEAIFVFVIPPSLKELKRRIVGRGSETSESLKLRLDEVVEEISQANWYDFLVVNDNLFEAVDKLTEVLYEDRVEDEDIEAWIKRFKEEKYVISISE